MALFNRFGPLPDLSGYPRFRRSERGSIQAPTTCTCGETHVTGTTGPFREPIVGVACASPLKHFGHTRCRQLRHCEEKEYEDLRPYRLITSVGRTTLCREEVFLNITLLQRPSGGVEPKVSLRDEREDTGGLETVLVDLPANLGAVSGLVRSSTNVL